MNRLVFSLALTLLVLFGSGNASAQSELDRARNLSTCLNGQYPTLCKRSWLSTEEVSRTDFAERRENLATCLTGQYAALCRRHLLSPDELTRVEAAERRVNLETCLQGKYAALCKKGKLTADELRRVEAAEHRENLETCLQGQYAALCKRNLLTQEESPRVNAAERRENLKICLTGQYKALCKKHLLNEQELQHVLAAENSVNFKYCQEQAAYLCDRSLLTLEQLQQLGDTETRRAPRVASAIAPASAAPAKSYPGCQSGYRVDSVSKSGEVVILDNGAVWEVDPIDAVDSKLWRPAAAIAVCATKLINVEQNVSVSGKRVR